MARADTWLWLGLATVGVLLMRKDGSTDTPKPQARVARQAMIDLVVKEARRQGVDPVVALAFADAESSLNPSAAGDLDWSSRAGGALYREHVLGNPALDANPARTDPKAWHSYGLFQLLAPYHVRGAEHPKLLYDPAINAQRGIGYLKALLTRFNGDVAEARLALAGALNVSQPHKDRILARFSRIYSQWNDHRGEFA